MQYSIAQRNARLASAAAVEGAAKATPQPAAPTSTQPTAAKNSGAAANNTVAVSPASKPILKGSVNTPTPPIAGAADNEKHITFVSPEPNNAKPEKVGLG